MALADEGRAAVLVHELPAAENGLPARADPAVARAGTLGAAQGVGDLPAAAVGLPAELATLRHDVSPWAWVQFRGRKPRTGRHYPGRGWRVKVGGGRRRFDAVILPWGSYERHLVCPVDGRPFERHAQGGHRRGHVHAARLGRIEDDMARGRGLVVDVEAARDLPPRLLPRVALPVEAIIELALRPAGVRSPHPLDVRPRRSKRVQTA